MFTLWSSDAINECPVSQSSKLFSFYRDIPEAPLQQVPQAQANLQVDPRPQHRSPRDQELHPMPIHTKGPDRPCIQVTCLTLART